MAVTNTNGKSISKADGVCSDNSAVWARNGFTKLISKFQVGMMEFSVEYFLFIPLTLAMLFEAIPEALGAAIGVVFNEFVLEPFSGNKNPRNVFAGKLIAF